jgi:asparagine N-glycosylation enzyme membrane subunit Stt3
MNASILSKKQHANSEVSAAVWLSFSFFLAVTLRRFAIALQPFEAVCCP